MRELLLVTTPPSNDCTRPEAPEPGTTEVPLGVCSTACGAVWCSTSQHTHTHTMGIATFRSYTHLLRLCLFPPPEGRVGIHLPGEHALVALHPPAPQQTVALGYASLRVEVRQTGLPVVHQLRVVGDHILHRLPVERTMAGRHTSNTHTHYGVNMFYVYPL